MDRYLIGFEGLFETAQLLVGGGHGFPLLPHLDAHSLQVLSPLPPLPLHTAPPQSCLCL